jgi:hypothetical protein
MNEYSREHSDDRQFNYDPATGRRLVIDTQPLGRPLATEAPVRSVVSVQRGPSGTAIAALVAAIIIGAAVICLIIVNNQQRTSDQQLEQERERAVQSQQPLTPAPQLAAPSQQQPVIVAPPQPAPPQPPPPVRQSEAAENSASRPSSADLEMSVRTKLLEDRDLMSYPVDVEVTDGVATLRGSVPSVDLKRRAERVASSVKGVNGIIDRIVVESPDR